jgi:LPXTG-site transpeptidase (sortase) family protein
MSEKKQKIVHPKAKITFRHNILPPLIGVLAFLEILAILNAQWVVAQYSYYFTKPVALTDISTQPANSDPNAVARIYVPRIGVDAPIVTNEKSYDVNSVQLALRRGVLQYGSTADPGQAGKVVIVGHSSGQLWAPGDYKFVFTLLDKLHKDDRIMIDFKGKRYIYRVYEEKVVPPSDISVLQQKDNDPTLSLITCTPVGTSKNRLVISARQIVPKPDTAAAIDPTKLHPVTSSVIPN